jgi:hypothetical protein
MTHRMTMGLAGGIMVLTTAQKKACFHFPPILYLAAVLFLTFDFR